MPLASSRKGSPAFASDRYSAGGSSRSGKGKALHTSYRRGQADKEHNRGDSLGSCPGIANHRPKRHPLARWLVAASRRVGR